MRRPTSRDDALEWWRSALAGEKPQITSEPHCGYFKRKLVRGGPWVPARIYLHQLIDDNGDLMQDEFHVCVVDGRVRSDVEGQWLYLCDNPITKEEYDRMAHTAQHAKRFDLDAPEATPQVEIDLLTVKPPSFKDIK